MQVSVNFICILFLLTFTQCGSIAGLSNSDQSERSNNQNLLIGLLSLNSQGKSVVSPSTNSEVGFEVESSSPSNSEIGVSTVPRIYVKFSADVDTNTVNSSSVLLLESTNQIVISIEYDSQSSFYIKPLGNLKVNKSYIF
jgi:hypothetical protein